MSPLSSLLVYDPHRSMPLPQEPAHHHPTKAAHLSYSQYTNTTLTQAQAGSATAQYLLG